MKKFIAAGVAALTLFQLPAAVLFPNIVYARADKKDRQKAATFYNGAITAMQNGDLRTAAKNFMEASDLDKENPLYAMFTGDMLLKLKQYPAALRYYKQSIENYSHGEKKQKDKIRIKSYLGASDACRKTGDMEGAKFYANELINDYPEDYRGYLALGRVYSENKSTYPDAIRELEKSIDLKKEQLASYLTLASVYSKQNDIDKVIDTYEMACDYRPLDESMKMSLAQVYFSYKLPTPHYKDAKRVLQSIIDVNAKNAMAYYYLALACVLDEDRPGAESALAALTPLNENLAQRAYQEIRAYAKKKASGDTEVVVRDAVDGEIITVDEKSNEEVSQMIDKQLEKLERNS